MNDLSGYVNKAVGFKFRGVELRFDLSHALFSSFDIDQGTRLLLKAVARDPVLAGARRVLDEGCGVGVIGLCVAKAFPEAEVALRDRDSLAVAFAERNRLANRLKGAPAWKDHETGAERRERPAPRAAWGLLADGREGGPYDFVLSNLPAKAGGPVLASFFARLSGNPPGPALLAPGGRAGVVVVNPLAGPAAAWIAEAGLKVVGTERGSGHFVYVVERGSAAVPGEPAALASALAAYDRCESRFKLADLSYRARGFWGLPEFDTPGFGTAAAAELLARLPPERQGAPFRDALFVNPGVGHLALWAARSLGLRRAVAASRDALSLEATGANLADLPGAGRPAYEAVDALCAAALPPESFDLLAECPDAVPEVDWVGPSWELAERLVRPGGLYLSYCSPTEAARLEKRRPTGERPTGERPGGGSAACSLAGRRRKKGGVALAWRKG